jgi:hypothetical protein
MKNKKEKNQKFFQYNLFPKNYRGILASEALKMIIAVICIGLLFYLGFSLFGIATQKTKVEQAKENLNQILAEINSLEDGEKGDFLVTSPKEWYLVGYEEGEEMPTQCKGRNCLCICPGMDLVKDAKVKGEDQSPYGNYFYTKEELAGYPTGGLDKCEKEGICKSINNEAKIREAYFGGRENPSPKGTTISFVNWISLYEIPKKLTFKKEAESVYISDVEIDSEILFDLLNKEVGFEEENQKINSLLTRLLGDCSEIKVNEDLKNVLEGEFQNYLNDLINKEEIKGGKIILSTFDSIWFSNLIFVSKGDEKSCSVLEEKKICSNKINNERTIGGYIRIYTCN